MLSTFLILFDFQCVPPNFASPSALKEYRFVGFKNTLYIWRNLFKSNRLDARSIIYGWSTLPDDSDKIVYLDMIHVRLQRRVY
jgi:hypothetical protein